MSYIKPLLTVFLLVCVIGWVRLGKGSRRNILTVGLLGLFLVSWPPAEWVFSRILEWPYPLQPFKPEIPPQAIVVLGSGINPPQYEQPYAVADIETLQHCAMAAWIYREVSQVPVLSCEGVHGRFPSVTRSLLKGGGVPDDQIWIEDRSTNTRQNAVMWAALLRQHGIHRIALVTDAQSMRRAAACFRKEGIAVLPAPCDFGQLDFTFDGLLPSSTSIRRNERTLHETLGMAWYFLKGWI
jgi:uncharacterized SAM-binding protein YcdF (DUF218 family)